MTRRGLAWISSTAEIPEHCREIWRDDPRRPYALPAGRQFDVVTVDQRLGIETFDQLRRYGLPAGPVMADWAARRVGFFLPAGSRERFERMPVAERAGMPSYRYIGPGSVVVVPGPMPFGGDRFTWLLAPFRQPYPTPVRTAALTAMLAAASMTLERVDQWGMEHTGTAPEDGEEMECRPG
ncbi:bifunctional DNA primase/polymerase [Streptomyces sp. ST2-7A]|nr:bifunctional DNA primase/polymerase [Streptomyces sp. ST2-7A]